MKLFLLFLFGSQSREACCRRSGVGSDTKRGLSLAICSLALSKAVDQFLLSFILFLFLGLEGERKLQVVEPSLKVDFRCDNEQLTAVWFCPPTFRFDSTLEPSLGQNNTTVLMRWERRELARRDRPTVS